MKLPQGDIKTKVWGNLTATVWRDRPKKKKSKHTVKHALLTTEGKFCDVHRKTVKLVTVHTRL